MKFNKIFPFEGNVISLYLWIGFVRKLKSSKKVKQEQTEF